jgi:hypothetical protein
VAEAYDSGQLKGPFAWERWYEDYRERVGAQPDSMISWPKGRYCSGFGSYWDGVALYSELIAEELPDWFQWYRDTVTDPAARPATPAKFRRMVEAAIARDTHTLMEELGSEARQKYRDLPYGHEGRPPEDSDIARFRDMEGNEDDSPVNIRYWPAQDMLRWLPEEISKRYGRVRFTVHDGDYLELSESHEDEIVSALEALGYNCVASSQLLLAACGE